MRELTQVSEVMQDLGYGDRTKHYQVKPSENSTTLSGLNVRGSLSKPPLIIPEKMPSEVIGEDYDLIRGILLSYQKSRMNWDDYAKKLEPSTRAVLEKVFFECRCNGFFNPHIEGDEINFQQMLKMVNKMKQHGELTPQDMRRKWDE